MQLDDSETSVQRAAQTAPERGVGAIFLTMILFMVICALLWVGTILNFLGSLILSLILTLAIAIPVGRMRSRRRARRLAAEQEAQLRAHRSRSSE